MRNATTEVQAALLAALEQLQAEHSKQVELLQKEQRSIYSLLSGQIETLTERLDSLTEQLDAGTLQTVRTTEQVNSLSGQLDGLGSLLETLTKQLKRP